tara:strand:- start:168 stop:362 length:195 start_codon:yes stop_codon:yes gene_type:complete
MIYNLYFLVYSISSSILLKEVMRELIVVGHNTEHAIISHPVSTGLCKAHRVMFKIIDRINPIAL